MLNGFIKLNAKIASKLFMKWPLMIYIEVGQIPNKYLYNPRTRTQILKLNFKGGGDPHRHTEKTIFIKNFILEWQQSFYLCKHENIFILLPLQVNFFNGLHALGNIIYTNNINLCVRYVFIFYTCEFLLGH